jgi:glutamate synthase domain-containing protein 2
MFWVIFTAFSALLGGLAGWSLGGQPSALAFTLVGIFFGMGLRDLTHHKHAILAITAVVSIVGYHFGGFELALVSAVLAFPIQIAVNEFVHRQSPFLPISLAVTFITWWLGWHFINPMSGLIFALLTFLTQVAVHDAMIQRNHAIRRNFPLLGWFRYGFELIGDELRQYWFMSDIEEKPYNRVTRRYIYRSAKGLNNNLGFGTQRGYRDVGEIHMLPSMFPLSDMERVGNRLPPRVIGAKRRKPYVCPSPINISGMSWGALSEEAVRALSSGAKMSNIHMLTGEGGLTPYHLEGVRLRPRARDVTTSNLRRLAKTVSFGLIKDKGEAEGDLVGGGRILQQIGPAKFGFRKTLPAHIAAKILAKIGLGGNKLVTEDGVSFSEAEQGLLSLYKQLGKPLPAVLLDIEKVLKVAAMDQIVGFEIKLAQGAKPGQGGKLPKEKITPLLAEWRGIPMGEDCYSPNAWDEFNDVPSLIRFVAYMQEVTGKPVGIKIVVGHEEALRKIAQEMKKTGNGPDFITIDGGEGGTGAAPVALADRMGMPILHAIPVVDTVLREEGVRDMTTLIASGQIAKGDDVAIAIAMGADMVNIGRGNLLAEGCIMALKCHTNHCPTGITTQDPRLRRGLDPQDKYVKVANYNLVLQRELLMFLRSVGVATPWELTRAHLSVVVAPMQEERMDKIHPYPDGSNGKRNPVLGEMPADDPETSDRFGPKLTKIEIVRKQK